MWSGHPTNGGFKISTHPVKKDGLNVTVRFSLGLFYLFIICVYLLVCVFDLGLVGF